MANQYTIIIVYLLLCLFIGFLGRKRKWAFWGYLWASLLFSPFLGLLFLLASDPKTSK
jgi:hypothetical protein